MSAAARAEGPAAAGVPGASQGLDPGWLPATPLPPSGLGEDLN